MHKMKFPIYIGKCNTYSIELTVNDKVVHLTLLKYYRSSCSIITDKQMCSPKQEHFKTNILSHVWTKKLWRWNKLRIWILSFAFGVLVDDSVTGDLRPLGVPWHMDGQGVHGMKLLMILLPTDFKIILGIGLCFILKTVLNFYSTLHIIRCVDDNKWPLYK